MVSYLAPLHLNSKYNSSDYNYQDGNISLKTGDSRYFIKTSPNVLSGAIVFNNQVTFNNFPGIFNSGISSYGNINLYNGASNNISLTPTGNINFTGTLNNTITTTVLSYIQNLSSDAQSQLSTLKTKTTNMSYTTGTTDFGSNNITTTGNINTAPASVFPFISTLSSDIQTQINNTNSSVSNAIAITNDATLNLSPPPGSLFSGQITYGSYNYVFNNGITSSDVYLTSLSSNLSQYFSRYQQLLTSSSVISANSLSCSTITTTANINGISPSIFNFLTGITSNVQGQFNNITTNYVTNLNLTSNYQPISAMSSYINTTALNAALSNYILATSMSAILAPYLLANTASSTYATISNLNTANTNITTANTNITALQTKTTNITYTTGQTSFGSNNILTAGYITCNSNVYLGNTTNGYYSSIFTYQDGNTYFDNFQSGGNFIFRQYVGPSNYFYILYMTMTSFSLQVPFVGTNISFTGTINTIPASTFAYIKNLTGDITTTYQTIAAMPNFSFSGNPSISNSLLPISQNDNKIASCAWVKTLGYLTSATAISTYQPIITSSTALSIANLQAVGVIQTSGTISTTGLLHGQIDSTSTINGISCLYYDISSSIQNQFNTVNTAIGTKQATITSSTVLTVGSTSTINSVTSSYYDPTSSIQNQFNTVNTAIGTKQATITSSTALTVGSLNSGTLHGQLDSTSTINGITSSYYDPTSSIQTQFINLRNEMMANYSLTCGGNIIWTGTYLLWSLRILCIPVPTTYGSNGYIQIDMPASGVVIPYYGITLTTKTTTASGIPLNAGVFDNLYYKITSIGTTASNGSFIIANYQSTTFSLDATYILIACANNDSGNAVCSFLPSKVNMPPNSSYYNGNGYGSWMQPNITSSTAITCGSITTSTGLITANAGLTIPSGQTLTVNGSINSSTITASGLITANAGLTMGFNQNITLASTFTTPTAGQLGYTVNAIGTAPQTIGNGTLTTICSMTVTPGVWNFYYGMTSLQALSATTAWNMSNSQMGLSTSGLAMSVGSMFWNSLYSTTTTQSFPAGVNGNCNLYQNYIATFTASTTIYLLVNITSNTTLQVYSGGIIRATRIA